jgi:GMP synthase-like glutamine amidotransferase
MRIHFLQHHPLVLPGCISEWALSSYCTMAVTRMYQSEPLPRVSEFDWLVVMGGLMGAYEDAKYPWLVKEKQLIKRAIEKGKTVIGICLGAQLIANVLGAHVYPNKEKEIGWFPIELTDEGRSSPVTWFLPKRLTVLHWHGDAFDLPQGAVHLAWSEACRNQAFVYGERVIGLQFHMEITARMYDGMKALNDPEVNSGGTHVQSWEEMDNYRASFAEMNRYMREMLDRIRGLGIEDVVTKERRKREQ